MYKWTLLALSVAVFGSLGQAAAPVCDTMQGYFMAYSNCSSSLYSYNSMVMSKEDFKQTLRNLCTSGASSYVSCLTSEYGACVATVKDVVINNAKGYKNRMCDGTSLKANLVALLDPMANMFYNNYNYNSTSTHCYTNAQVSTELYQCSANIWMNSGTGIAFMNKTIAAGLPFVSKYYRRTLICYRRVLRAHSTCTSQEIQAMLAYYMMMLPIAGLKEQDLLPATNAKPREGKRMTLAAFGDPHLVVYKQTNLRTCSAPGEQVYLENDFIVITANNTLVGSGSATVITDINIELMDKAGKVKAKYSAGNSLLPDSFKDGKDKIKIDDKETEVSTSGRLMRIKIPSAGVVIFLSKYKHMYPLLLVRGSESLFDASSGLLVDDCSETISRTTTRRKRATSGCQTACAAQAQTAADPKDKELEEACVFDCTETGDEEFAKQAGADMGSAEKEAEQADQDMSDEKQNGAKTVTWSLISMVIMVVCTSIMH